MNLQTFTASTLPECITKVKAALGRNPVILHTRSYSKREWLGLRKRMFYEITAARSLASQPPARATPSTVLQPFATSGAVTKSAVLRVHDAPGTAISTASPPGRDLLNSPVVNTIVTQQVARDVDELKKLVSGLVDTLHRKDAPNVPQELFDEYMCLISNHVADELAGDIVATLRKQIRPEHLNNGAFIKDKIAEQIEKLIPTSGPIVRTKAHGPHVVALIGPTGVGKTTTIAKLAANLKLVEKKNVGLITIDTYRIAAIDQLRRYAQILGSPLLVTNNAEDLRQAVKTMSDCEFILIDTAGRSPRDMMKIHELKTFLDAACPDEIHLVLSSTAGQDCLELAMERFDNVHFDKIIFTKLDEAAHIGVMLNTIHNLKKSVSYVTTGQDVPDDIEVGEGRKLARWILGDRESA